MDKKIREILSYILVLGLVAVAVFIQWDEDDEAIIYQDQSYLLGVDVSRYQGEIDYDLLYDQGVRYAFIKATEGRAHLDPFFYENFKKGMRSDVRIGAYHFFLFDIPGKDQGQYFVDHVPNEKDLLPPVIDIEHYGKYINNPMDYDTVYKEMSDLIDVLYNKYQKYPIIYCNYYIYKDYIQGNFEECDIWFRSISEEIPELPDGREWKFWQYSETGELEGYGGSGFTDYIDLNYFDGTMRELNRYGK